MVMQINVRKMVANIKMKLDVNVSTTPSVEIVKCVIQLTTMHLGNQLVYSMHMHAKVEICLSLRLFSIEDCV